MDHHPHLPRGLIQVAGVHDLEEAQQVLESGADLVGIPLRLAFHAEDLSEAAAVSISRNLPGKVCLITYLQDPSAIEELVRELAVDFLQLHGDIPVTSLATVRQRCPDLILIKSLVIGSRSPAALEALLKDCAPWVDAFITDTFDPETGAEGATGRLHDWNASRRLVALSPRPLLLAGGLRPENVTAAIHAVQPHGVDVHTGVEGLDGRKDPTRLRAFIEAARTAFK